MRKSVAESIFSDLPFESGRAFDTGDVAEARHFYSGVFSPHKLRLVGSERPLRACLDHVPVGALSLNRHTWQAQVEVDPGWLDGYYLLCLPLKGISEYRNGSGVASLSAGQFAIVGGQQRFNFSASADFEQIAVRIDQAAVNAGWSALSGETSTAPICFQSEIQMRGQAWEAIVPVLRLIAQCAKGELEPIRSAHLQRHLEESLVTTLLLNQPHSLLRRRQPVDRALPMHFSRAQEYMLDHLEEPLTLAAVANAVGVPGRTLQWAFQEATRMGPIQWLKVQRLQAVRAALLTSQEPIPRITDTALRFGFTHLGEFSRHYRRAFGEVPRDTLKKRS